MCVDYRDLNKASPKDNFSLQHIDTLVDNTAGYSLFSFMDDYRKVVLELLEEFDNITFSYLPRNENQMADALVTLASMIKANKKEDVRPI